MPIILSSEAQMVRDTAMAFFAERSPVASLRKLRDTADPDGFSRSLWREMADLGWTGFLVSEDHGGTDFGVVGLAQVMEAAGRTLTASPLVSTALAGASTLGLAGSDDQKSNYLPPLVAGELILALALEDGYPIALRMQAPAFGGVATMDFSPLWLAILDDLERQTPAGVMAARFHRGLVRAIVEMVCHIFERENRRLERTVALSGGSFQNRLLLEGVSHAFEGLGLSVLTHSQVPANDGGLALGQAAIAAARSMASRHRSRRKVTSCA